MASLLAKTNSTSINSLCEDGHELEDKIRRLTTQNELIYRSTLSREDNNHQIHHELQFIKSSIQNLKNDLRSFDGSSSNRHLCSSHKTYKTCSSQLDQSNLAHQLPLQRASLNRKSHRTVTQDSLPNFNSTLCTLFVPLNKLLNCSYLRQSTSNSLIYFSLDKTGHLSAPKNYLYKTPVHTQLDTMLNQCFSRLSNVTSLTFYLMNGLSKSMILHRLLEKINYLIDSDQIDQILVADGVSILESKGLQEILQSIMQEIEEPEVNLIQSVDALYNVLVKQKQRFSQLKQIISDQVKIQSGANKKEWVNCKVKRNIAFQIRYDSGKVLNVVILNESLDSVQSELKNKWYVNDPYSYLEVIKSIRQSKAVDERLVLALNPERSGNKRVEEYLKFGKTKE